MTTHVMLIQFAFFSVYFLFSAPWSKIVNRIGYQKTMVVGLLIMSVGAFLFVPAASAPLFPLFLTALTILPAGITGLQVAANPYVIVLGKPDTASSRLNLTQAFNSPGTTLASQFGGLLILSAAPLAGFSPQTAAGYVSFYWAGAMVGRFIGAAVLRRIKTGICLRYARFVPQRWSRSPCSPPDTSQCGA